MYMKQSKIMMLVGGLLIGFSLAGQFTPFRDWIGGSALPGIAVVFGVLLVGMASARAIRGRSGN